MSNTSNTKSGGIGFFGLLTVALIVLKLTGTIAWSWWWVLLPLWFPFSAFIVVAGAILLAAYTGKLR